MGTISNAWHYDDCNKSEIFWVCDTCGKTTAEHMAGRKKEARLQWMERRTAEIEARTDCDKCGGQTSLLGGCHA